MADKIVIAYVRVDMPLVFVKKGEFRNSIIDIIAKESTILEFEGYDSNEFSVSLEHFVAAFPGHQWRSEACDTDGFSANDLVWLTAT